MKRVVCTACLRRVFGVSRATGRCDDCATVNQPRRPHTVDPWLPYAQDEAAQRFVEEHPDGATLEEVGEALGLVKQRVDQIERVALARFAKRCRLAGISADDVAGVFTNRRTSQERAA